MRGPEDSMQLNPEEAVDQPSSSLNERVADIPTPARRKGILEGAKDYLKYKDLKIRESLGLLNQEEFDRLLALDFQEQTESNKPIEGVFSPEEELAKIRALPREQKGEALVAFKENLARQRESLAALRVFIERSIEFDHDTPQEKLTGLVEKFSAQYGFNDQQKQICGRLIDGYYEYRQKALEARQRFVNDHELVEELTGLDLGRDQKIGVSVGPMTIDIETSGANVILLRLGLGAEVIAARYGGFAAQSIGENPLYYVVINNDGWGISKEGVRNHEHEHQKNRLFRTVFEHTDAPTRLVGYAEEQGPELKRAVLEDFFDKSRKAAFEQAKDEITAWLNNRSLPTLQKQLPQIFDTYDYLGYLRDWEKFKNDALYQETAQKMLVREYRETVTRAVDSCVELAKKSKLSNQEVIALLTDKPLEDWPKTIQRLLEQQG